MQLLILFKGNLEFVAAVVGDLLRVTQQLRVGLETGNAATRRNSLSRAACTGDKKVAHELVFSLLEPALLSDLLGRASVHKLQRSRPHERGVVGVLVDCKHTNQETA